MPERPASSSLRELDRQHLLHPLSQFRVLDAQGPRIFRAGSGIELELEDGRRLIDGFSGLFNVNVGHGRTEIAEAVAAQMRKLAYYPSFWDFGNEPAAQLAARIAGLLPADRALNRMFFHSSGSEANEANIRIARLYQRLRGYPERTQIVSRRWSYHGATRAASAATGIDAYHLLSERDPAHLHAAPPYCYRCEFQREHPGCGLACAEDLAQVIERAGPERVAAILVEPVLGTGGIVIPPPDYFARVQEICRHHGVLLILDEVITGFGRTGRWFGMEHWDIRPDLVSLAKGITSGALPLSASVVSEPVYEVLRDEMPRGLPFMFGFTAGNHPACCAAALANLDILEREDLVGNAQRVGAHLLARLRERFADSPIVGEIRGLGMLAALEIVRDRESRQPFPNPGDTHWIAQRAFDAGLIVRGLFQSVGLAPPLCTSEAEADRMVEILGRIWPEAEDHVLRQRRD